jgi:hypothetical protein
MVIAWPAPARAGEYVVTQCSTIEPSAGQASWEQSAPGYGHRNRCGSDEGLQAFHDAPETPLWHYGGWVWRAPVGTVFTDVQANASLSSQAGHRGALVATTPAGEAIEFGSEHNDFRVHSVAGEFSQFHAWLRCVAPGPGRPCGRAGSDSAHAYVRGVYLRTSDRAAPAVELTGGSLLEHPVVRGTRGLVFDAADQGSGIRRVWVEANGQPLVIDLRNCALAAGFATALSPCPATSTESAAVPTAASAFATGPNVVSACVEDLALDGAPNRACEQSPVWVDNACPGSAAAGAEALDAGFAGADSAVVRSDRGAVIRGRLRGAGAGATVCALSAVAAAASPIVVAATALTAADGSFAIPLPPGPSRELFVHHAVGDLVLARHGLSLRSSVRASLRVTPRRRLRNGRRLHFAGRLPAPACEDRLVKVQARIGRRRWQVFRTDRSDDGCRFAARYRLRATSGARRYRFRATVPAQAGYPFEPGSSPTVSVRTR